MTSRPAPDAAELALRSSRRVSPGSLPTICSIRLIGTCGSARSFSSRTQISWLGDRVRCSSTAGPLQVVPLEQLEPEVDAAGEDVGVLDAAGQQGGPGAAALLDQPGHDHRSAAR